MPPPETPCTADEAAARGAHVLQLTGYSGLGTCNNIGTARCFHESSAFTVGGYDWVLRFYLDGDDDDEPGSEGYIALKLALHTSHARVRASFNLGLVDHATGRPAFQPQDVTAVFDTTPGHRGRKHSSHGRPRLMTRRELEACPAYLHDDTVAVACVVTVVSGSSAPPGFVLLEPEPEPDLPQHIGELLISQDGADVTFDVDGEAFAAHRIILAARSPVFEEELYGGSPAAETDDAHHHVTVGDMRPAVFRALLHFVYTDSLPAMGDLSTDEIRELVQHLLAAADRYAMDRLRVVCEHILARTIHEGTVDSMLVLADRYRCHWLKEACVDSVASSDQLGDGAARSVGEDDS